MKVNVIASCTFLLKYSIKYPFSKKGAKESYRGIQRFVNLSVLSDHSKLESGLLLSARFMIYLFFPVMSKLSSYYQLSYYKILSHVGIEF